MWSNTGGAGRAGIGWGHVGDVAPAWEAGRSGRAKGGGALDIFATILDVRYGGTRRRVTASPHTVELNAEAFRRCRDLMIKSAVSFQADLENLVIELQAARLLKLNGEFTAAQIAQALADGGRAVNQALPPIARDGFSARYRQMCAMVLYGCAVMPKRR